MPSLYLLDAYALIYRAYYGLFSSPLVNSKGQNVSAVHGFVSTLWDIVQKEQPDYLGVAFDPTAPPSAMRPSPPTRPSARRLRRTSDGPCP